MVNKNLIDLHTGYFHFIRLQQSQNQTFRELRFILNPIPSPELYNIRDFIPMCTNWRLLQPKERNLQAEPSDIDLESIDYSQMTGFYPGGFIIDTLDFYRNDIPALTRMEMYQNISDLTDAEVVHDLFEFNSNAEI